MHVELRKPRGPGRLVAAALLSLFIIGFTGQAAPAQPTKPAKPSFDKNSRFYFDGAISRQTLENYLDRAITMGYFLVPGQPERYQFPYRDDDVRLIHNIGAKFIGRAIYRWSEESKLGDPAFLEYAKKWWIPCMPPIPKVPPSVATCLIPLTYGAASACCQAARGMSLVLAVICLGRRPTPRLSDPRRRWPGGCRRG